MRKSTKLCTKKCVSDTGMRKTRGLYDIMYVFVDTGVLISGDIVIIFFRQQYNHITTDKIIETAENTIILPVNNTTYKIYCRQYYSTILT